MNKFFGRSYSLTWKAIAFLLVVSVFNAACFYFVFTKQAKEFEAYNESAVASVVSLFKISVNDFIVTGDLESIQKVVDKSVEEGLIYGISIFEDGKNVLTYPNDLNRSLSSVEVTDLQGFGGDKTARFNLYINQQAISKSKDRFFIWAECFIACVLGTMLLIWLFINKRIVQPLLTLTASAKEISQGNYAFKAQTVGTDEIDLLTESLEDMSKELKLRSEAMENHVRELVNAQGEIVIANHDRTRYIDTLINDTSPYLTDALVTLQTLSDRPIQQKIINKVLLFVVAQLEQARALIDESNVPFELSVEKFTVEEFSKIVKEYGIYFGKTRGMDIEYKLKGDSSLDANGIFFLIDTKILIKLFSLIFEIMTPKIEVGAPIKSTIWLVVDGIDSDKADIDIIIKSSNSFISDEDCKIINTFMERSETSGFELDDLALSSKQNKLACQSLKSLADYLRANYSVNNVHGLLESRFKCRVVCCKESESISDRMDRLQKTSKTTNTLFVGSAALVSKSHLSKGFVNVKSYAAFLAMDNLDGGLNYVIDHITQPEMAILAISKLKDKRIETGNFSVLISASGLNDELIEFFYEAGVDIIIKGYLDSDNLKKVCSPKIRTKDFNSIFGMITANKE